MKIMFIISSMGLGGAQRVIANITNTLVENGHEIIIATFRKEAPYYALHRDIKIRFYDINLSNKISTFLSNIKSVRCAIKENQPDVIISFLATTNIYSIIGNLYYRIPIIVSERNDPKRVPSAWYYRILRKLVYRYADGFIFQTVEVQNFFSKKIRKKSIVIPNPINTKGVDFKFKRGQREKKIVSVGRLEVQKNFKLLIDSFEIISEEFKEYKLIIYGEGSQRSELENYISTKNLNGRVLLPGRVKDIYSKIRNSSVFVLSSDYEGMPNALLEALALGIPCISTNCMGGGARELISSGYNGEIVPVKNKKLLAGTIKKFLLNDKYAEGLALKAREVCKDYSIEKISNIWEEYLNNIYLNH